MKTASRLLLLCMIEGAAVMVCELAGQRMMAPLFGNTLKTWSIIISVTMIGLGSGYFIGGKLASNKNPFEIALKLLFGAGFLTAVMPWVGEFVLINSARINFLFGMFVAPLLYLLPALVLMGSFSPVMIAVLATYGNGAGTASGKVYATSTLGGILATLLTAFVLLESVGIKHTLLATGLVVMLCALVAGLKQKSWFMALLIPIVCGFVLHKKTSSEHFHQLFLCDGAYGQLRVIEVKYDSETVLRMLMNNNIAQSYVRLPDLDDAPPYVTPILEIVKQFRTKSDIILLGLGGGIIAKKVEQAGYTIHAVEIDPMAVQLAFEYFQVPKTIDIHIGDARILLPKLPVSKLIIADFFASESLPSHLFVREYFDEIYKKLPQDGVFLINSYGYTDAENGAANAAIYATLNAVGFSTQFLAENKDPNFRNGLFIAQKSSNLEVAAFLQHQKTLQDLSQELAQQQAEIYTDNKSSIESDVMRAATVWRTNYYHNLTHRMLAEGLPLF